ncbi:g12977 [Coccomyxa viridis]|uniref:G12977 protein n=1 Tax=Coccomyxa viridis TaxID=1274662 RepID=A0ABP1GEA2_9CHLO
MAGTRLYVVDVCAHDRPFGEPGRRHSPDTMNIKMLGGARTLIKEIHRISFSAEQNPEDLISREVQYHNLDNIPWDYSLVPNDRVFQREIHAFDEVYYFVHGANFTYLKTTKKGFAITRMLGHDPSLSR